MEKPKAPPLSELSQDFEKGEKGGFHQRKHTNRTLDSHKSGKLLVQAGRRFYASEGRHVCARFEQLCHLCSEVAGILATPGILEIFHGAGARLPTSNSGLSDYSRLELRSGWGWQDSTGNQGQSSGPHGSSSLQSALCPPGPRLMESSRSAMPRRKSSRK